MSFPDGAFGFGFSVCSSQGRQKNSKFGIRAVIFFRTFIMTKSELRILVAAAALLVLFL
jgi:hypothetical protein